MKKQKILITASTFPRWENDKVSSFIFFLARKLLKHYEVFVLAPHFRGAKTYEMMEGIHVYRFKYFFDALEVLTYGSGTVNNLKGNRFVKLLLPFYLLSNFIWLIFLNCRHSFTVVNVHWILPTGILAVILKPVFKFKLVISSHGGDIYGITNSNLGKFLGVGKLNSIVLNHSDAIIPVSNSIGKIITQILNENKVIEVCPMGIDYNRFLNVDKKFNARNNKILFLGRLAPEKGLNYLMEAASKLNKKNINFELDIAGSGSEEEYVRSKILEYSLQKKVKLLGYINNSKVNELLLRYDLFISTSIREGLPTAYMEAMAAGLICIVSNTNGIEDLIDNSVNGLIYDIADVEALVHNIESILNNEKSRTSISMNAQKKAKNYDWEIISDKYYEVFNKA